MPVKKISAGHPFVSACNAAINSGIVTNALMTYNSSYQTKAFASRRFATPFNNFLWCKPNAAIVATVV
jgi:hypothetical protein